MDSRLRFYDLGGASQTLDVAEVQGVRDDVVQGPREQATSLLQLLVEKTALPQGVERRD